MASKGRTPWPSCQNVTLGRPLVKGAYQEIKFSYFSSNTHVVGTQKNRLNETVLLSTQNMCSKRWVRKY